jgi:hypothetical protein
MREVYGARAAGSGGAGPVSCDAPEVEVATFTGDEDGALIFLNHSNRQVTAQVTVDRPVVDVSDLRGGSATPVGGYTLGVPLAPNGTAALRVGFVEGGGASGDDEPDEGAE